MTGQRFKLLKKYFKDIYLTAKKMFYSNKSQKISLIFKDYSVEGLSTKKQKKTNLKWLERKE